MGVGRIAIVINRIVWRCKTSSRPY